MGCSSCRERFTTSARSCRVWCALVLPSWCCRACVVVLLVLPLMDKFGAVAVFADCPPPVHVAGPVPRVSAAARGRSSCRADCVRRCPRSSVRDCVARCRSFIVYALRVACSSCGCTPSLCASDTGGRGVTPPFPAQNFFYAFPFAKIFSRLKM